MFRLHRGRKLEFVAGPFDRRSDAEQTMRDMKRHDPKEHFEVISDGQGGIDDVSTPTPAPSRSTWPTPEERGEVITGSAPSMLVQVEEALAAGDRVEIHPDGQVDITKGGSDGGTNQSPPSGDGGGNPESAGAQGEAGAAFQGTDEPAPHTGGDGAPPAALTSDPGAPVAV